MPYKVAFIPLCEHDGCKKFASYSVFGWAGTHFGHFCEQHADAKLQTLMNERASPGDEANRNL